MNSTNLIANTSKFLIDLMLQFFVYLLAFFAFVAAININYSFGVASVVSSFVAIKSFSLRFPSIAQPQKTQKPIDNFCNKTVDENSTMISVDSMLNPVIAIEAIDEELAHHLKELYDDDHSKIRNWLCTPKASLNGQSPIQSMIDEQKLNKVKGTLVKSIHGMLA